MRATKGSRPKTMPAGKQRIGSEPVLSEVVSEMSDFDDLDGEDVDDFDEFDEDDFDDDFDDDFEEEPDGDFDLEGDGDEFDDDLEDTEK